MENAEKRRTTAKPIRRKMLARGGRVPTEGLDIGEPQDDVNRRRHRRLESLRGQSLRQPGCLSRQQRRGIVKQGSNLFRDRKPLKKELALLQILLPNADRRNCNPEPRTC